ncbi:hypothetical protein C0214_19665 [Methylobacterium sp. DM1]|nr:hypothetical protein C0214_19665 [Methylobacterium sp. DM1]
MAGDILVSSDSSFLTVDNELGRLNGNDKVEGAFARPYSLNDLVQRIAVRLGAVGDGQPVQPEDAHKIRYALPAIVSDLDMRDVASFPSLDNVPPSSFLFLADIAASALSSEFGLPQDEIVTLASRAQAAEGRLRQHRSLPYSGAPVRACYF